MKIFISIVVFVVVVIAIGLIYMYSGSYDVSAANKDEGLSRWVLETTMDNSVEHHAKDIQVPALDDSAMIWKGFNHYNRMCKGCHGFPGREAAKSFNPAPPELDKTASDWKPNELYWIIKNGVKMSAMPSFGERHKDDDLWAIVAFLQKLPKLTPEQYKAMDQKSREMSGMQERDRD